MKISLKLMYLLGHVIFLRGLMLGFIDMFSAPLRLSALLCTLSYLYIIFSVHSSPAPDAAPLSLFIRSAVASGKFSPSLLLVSIAAPWLAPGALKVTRVSPPLDCCNQDSGCAK